MRLNFGKRAGYDYIKLQPKVDFNPLKIDLVKMFLTMMMELFLESGLQKSDGVINSLKDFEKYSFPKSK